jgi:phosphoadenosine phosphosulfate reductase
MEDLSRIYDLPADNLGPRALWQSFRRAVNHDISHLFRLYVSGVSKFDRGRFSLFIRTLKDLGIWDRALTVIFSDHGEGRCFYHDPSFFAHAGELYDNVLRVPLLIHASGITPQVSDALVSLVDIFPTVLALAGVNGSLSYSLDGINCYNGCRSSVYAEVWNAPKGLPDVRRYREIEENEWLLLQRCIRTKTKKLVLTGKQEDFREKATFELPEEDFVRFLYRKVLARFEDQEGFTHYVHTLKEGIRTKEKLLGEFLQCEEYRSRPRACLYDLVNDPEEEKPQAPGESLLSLMEAYDLLKEILHLESCTVEGEKIFAENKIGSSVSDDDLSGKEQRSMEIIREAYGRFGEACGVAFTGGKDSTVLLHLIRRVFQDKVPFKVINIDTGVKFEEVYRFRDRMRQEWGLDLHVFRNDEVLRWLKVAQNPEECCYHLKAYPMKRAIEELGLKALFTGVRWDENPARAEEEYFSERSDPSHVRVHPLLHFTEQDIWDYIRKHKVPYCPLYDQGYRSLGCKPCTRPAVEGGHERAGRAQGKEKIMQRLRELGYF